MLALWSAIGKLVLSSTAVVGLSALSWGQAGATRPATPEPPAVQRWSSDNQAEYARVEQQARAVAARARKAAEGSEERAALEKQLHGLLAAAFDARQKWQAEEADQLSKQLEAVKSRLEERASQKDKIIDKRLRDLLDAENLAWDEPAFRYQPAPPAPPPSPYSTYGSALPPAAPSATVRIPLAMPSQPSQTRPEGTTALLPVPSSSLSPPPAKPPEVDPAGGISIGFPDDLVASMRSASQPDDREAIRTIYHARLRILKSQLDSAIAENNIVQKQLKAGSVHVLAAAKSASRAEQLKTLFEMYGELGRYFTKDRPPSVESLRK